LASNGPCLSRFCPGFCPGICRLGDHGIDPVILLVQPLIVVLGPGLVSPGVCNCIGPGLVSPGVAPGVGLGVDWSPYWFRCLSR